MEKFLPLIILLPIIGATIIGIFGFVNESFRKQESVIGSLATLMVAVPFVLIAYTFFTFEGPVTFELFTWMLGGETTIGSGEYALDISFSYTLDHLSLVMGMIVTGVGSLIHIYSIGYMHGDGGYYKFFTYLNLFIFAMLNLILGNNMAVLFLGWEGVGACSYFLIGFWYQDMAKSAAAQKAFVVNRIGDFAMIAAMLLTYNYVGSINFDDILAADWGAEAAPTSWVAFCVFMAATGKSAQIPLFVWLPDAMAGPTPVSALIHAATMVTSGVYLCARLSEIFLLAPGVMAFVSIIACSTALIAALMALAQNDIKGVLAYSTVSQLGFMFMAIGAGAFTTAIFHVMTHAFFKACLFLGSGSVIHAMDHTHAVEDGQDIRTMGGLKKYMPSTHLTFAISTIAISGLPFLSGFFSKDEIMGKIFAMGFESGLYFFVWGVGMFTALLTAFYMTRVYWLTFQGKERFDAKDHPPHESPATMTLPLWVLAILAIVGGYVGLPAVIGENAHVFNHWLEGSVNLEHIEHVLHHHISHAGEWGLIAFSIAIAALGVFASARLFNKHNIEGDTKLRKIIGGFYQWMADKFYIDEFYNVAIVRPFVSAGEDLIMAFDKYVIDGFLHGVANVINQLGKLFRLLQSGLVSHYATVIVLGMLILLTYFFLA